MAPISRFLDKSPLTQVELVQKALNYLSSIGTYLIQHGSDLPIEIRRDRQHFANDRELFSILDLHLGYNTLTKFLENHPSCKEQVVFIFGGKYPQLIQDPALRQALEDADGTTADDTQKILSKKRSSAGTSSSSSNSWVAKRRQRDDGSWIPVPEQERKAVAAFEAFDTPADDPRMPPSARDKFLVRAVFEVFKRKLNGDSQAPNGEVRPMGTHISFTLPQPATEAAESSTMAGQAQKNVMSEFTVTEPKKNAEKMPDINETAESEPCIEYKGHILEPPHLMLLQLKEYLSSPNVEQRANWATEAAEIQDFLAQLLQIRNGHSWSDDLDEVVEMFGAHTIYESFHNQHPGLDHTLWPDIMGPVIKLPNPIPDLGSQDPSQLTRVRKGKRNVKQGTNDTVPSPYYDEDNEEDLDLLPLDTLTLADATYKEATDPFLYTRWHNRMKTNLELASESAKWKTAEELEKTSKSKNPFTCSDVPSNRTGPISSTQLLEREARISLGDRIRLRLLCSSLRRLGRRAPRPLLDEVNRYVRLGMSHTDTDCVDQKAFERLQKQEIRWLDYLNQPSQNIANPYKGLDRINLKNWRLAVLCKRLRKIMSSLEPGTFPDGQLVTLQTFMELVNEPCDGPVVARRFTIEELKYHMPQLIVRRIVRFIHEGGVEYIQACPGEVNAEDALRWPRKSSIGSGMGDPEQILEPENPDVPSMIPRFEDLRSVMECLNERDEINRNYTRTAALFCRLAYRLGRTVQEVEAQNAEYACLLSDPDYKRRNMANLEVLTTHWATNMEKEDVPPSRNGRAIRTYRDIVLAAEPEILEEMAHGSEDDVEMRCKDLVRQKILREASENKTMLWPLSVPPESDVGPVLVGDGQTVARREALWSFAKVSKTSGLTKQFFDVNNWPPGSKSTTRTRADAPGKGLDVDEDRTQLSRR